MPPLHTQTPAQVRPLHQLKLSVRLEIINAIHPPLYEAILSRNPSNANNAAAVRRRKLTMAPRGTRAYLGRAQTTMDMELSSPSLRPSVEFLLNHNQPSPAHAKDREYVPPNGGYGWVCVVCVFLINAHTWGLNFVSWPLHSSPELIGQEILTCQLHVVIHGADLAPQ